MRPLQTEHVIISLLYCSYINHYYYEGWCYSYIIVTFFVTVFVIKVDRKHGLETYSLCWLLAIVVHSSSFFLCWKSLILPKFINHVFSINFGCIIKVLVCHCSPSQVAARNNSELIRMLENWCGFFFQPSLISL